MESIGDTLREAREVKGISVDQVAQETHISKAYIEALECEDFSQFPGETYIFGFLRNYADYLGLDPSRAIDMYKNFKVREQPVPMDELLGRNQPSSRGFLAVGVVGALILVGLAVFFIPRGIQAFSEYQTARAAQKALESSARDIQIYKVTEEVLENRFYQGDQLLVPLGDREFLITLTDVNERLFLEWDEGTLSLALGEEHYLDLDEDGVLDLRVALRDIDMSSGDGGVLLMSHLMEQGEQGKTAESIDSSAVTGELSEGIVIMEDIRPQPFRLDAVFRGYGLLRYRSDNRAMEQEYFREGDRFRLEVNRSVQLGVSNGGSLILKIGGRELDLGGSGKVSVKLIRWEINEETGQYQLKAREVY